MGSRSMPANARGPTQLAFERTPAVWTVRGWIDRSFAFSAANIAQSVLVGAIGVIVTGAISCSLHIAGFDIPFSRREPCARRCPNQNPI